MNRSHILIIGAAGLDTKGRAIGPLQPGTSNPGSIRTSVGGVARNVAENLARLGEHAVLLSAVTGSAETYTPVPRNRAP